jgi:hypothetical protein
LKLDSTLKNLGFDNSPSEHALYTRGNGRLRILLGVYVDDLIFTGADADEISKVKLDMMERFRMSDLSLLHFYLGIKVNQNKDSIVMSQGSYATKLLEHAGIANCNPALVPIEPQLKLSKDSQNPATDVTFCRSVVGCLVPGAHQT